MRLRLQARRGGSITSIWIMVMLAFLLPFPNPAAAIPPVSKNKLTVINQSGEDTAIKIMGPREWMLEIPNGQERTILLPSGDYTYLTRYGQDPDFRYSRGTPFYIEPSKIGFTEATLTLISAPSSTYVDPALMELFNRPIAPPPEPPAVEKASPTPDKVGPAVKKTPAVKTEPVEKPPVEGKQAVAKAEAPKPNGSDFILHRVAEGENMPSIAEWYSGETDFWPEIAKFNTSADPFHLKPGTVVKVPIYLAIVHTNPPPPPKTVSAPARKPTKPTKRMEKPPVLAPPAAPPVLEPKGPFGPK